MNQLTYWYESKIPGSVNEGLETKMGVMTKVKNINNYFQGMSTKFIVDPEACNPIKQPVYKKSPQKEEKSGKQEHQR